MWSSVVTNSGLVSETAKKSWAQILEAWETQHDRQLLRDVLGNDTKWRAWIKHCDLILTIGFSAAAAGLGMVCGLHLHGLRGFLDRLEPIAAFLRANPGILAGTNRASADSEDYLRHALSCTSVLRYFISDTNVEPPRLVVFDEQCEIRAEGGFTPGASSDQYYQEGIGFTCTLRADDANAEALAWARSAVLEALTNLEQLADIREFLDPSETQSDPGKFDTENEKKKKNEKKEAAPALANILKTLLEAFEHEAEPARPSTAEPSAGRTAGGSAAVPLSEALRLLTRQHPDAFTRPYLEAALQILQARGAPALDILAQLKVLPPQLEGIDGIFEYPGLELVSNRDGTLGVPAPASLKEILAAIQESGAHAMILAFLGRAEELTRSRADHRIKCVAEDRLRWCKLIERRIVGPGTFRERLRGLMSQWTAIDPASAALHGMAAALDALEQIEPIEPAQIRKAQSEPMGVVKDIFGKIRAAPDIARSAFALREELERLLQLSSTATGNPVPFIYLTQAVAALDFSDYAKN